MDLSESFVQTLPDATRERYDWCEVRNAASIIAHTNPQEFADLLHVLDGFALDVDRDIIVRGGNESLTAAVLNSAFRARGWREGSYDVQLVSELTLKANPAAHQAQEVIRTEVSSPSYLVDNVKGRVALDVEWHAKDGNLDRDIAAYRALYDAGIIDGAIMVTMTRQPLRQWAVELDPETKKFATSTTTNFTKVLPRLTRGDGGGCPILIASICRRTV